MIITSAVAMSIQAVSPLFIDPVPPAIGRHAFGRYSGKMGALHKGFVVNWGRKSLRSGSGVLELVPYAQRFTVKAREPGAPSPRARSPALVFPVGLADRGPAGRAGRDRLAVGVDADGVDDGRLGRAQRRRDVAVGVGQEPVDGAALLDPEPVAGDVDDAVGDDRA